MVSTGTRLLTEVVKRDELGGEISLLLRSSLGNTPTWPLAAAAAK